MEKGQFWTIAGVAVIIAIVSSIITTSITGNILKVPTSISTTQVDVYTKTEVDDLLSVKTTNKAVLDMLDKNCAIWSVAKPSASRHVTGDDICQENNAGVCVLTIKYEGILSSDMIQKCTPFTTGRSDKTKAYCCKP